MIFSGRPLLRLAGATSRLKEDEEKEEDEEEEEEEEKERRRASRWH